jgi:hypothetical protein
LGDLIGVIENNDYSENKKKSCSKDPKKAFDVWSNHSKSYIYYVLPFETMVIMTSCIFLFISYQESKILHPFNPISSFGLRTFENEQLLCPKETILQRTSKGLI